MPGMRAVRQRQLLVLPAGLQRGPAVPAITPKLTSTSTSNLTCLQGRRTENHVSCELAALAAAAAAGDRAATRPVAHWITPS